MKRQNVTGYLFVMPALVLFTLLILFPAVKTIYYSLFDWPGFGEMKFVGLTNYITAIFEDIYLVGALKNNVIYLVLTLIFEVAFGLFMAVLLDQKLRFSGIYRALFFAPMMLSMVVVGLLWGFIFDVDYGLLNAVLKTIGLEHWTRAWMSDPDFALLGICLTSGWRYAGFFMILFYAGLQRIPRQLIESAQLDGAGEWRVFWNIKLPLLREVMVVSVLLCATGAFKLFDLVYVLTTGGPYHATEVISTWMVRNAFDRFNMGYGSAIAVIMSVIVFLVAMSYLLYNRRKETVEF
ncbi:sugar ABC transporter permease [candidate division KSB1 bacterium]|nr:sugar ABC transporter permease [candidate division KSB1 bacterium]